MEKLCAVAVIVKQTSDAGYSHGFATLGDGGENIVGRLVEADLPRAESFVPVIKARDTREKSVVCDAVERILVKGSLHKWQITTAYQMLKSDRRFLLTDANIAKNRDFFKCPPEI